MASQRPKKQKKINKQILFNFNLKKWPHLSLNGKSCPGALPRPHLEASGGTCKPCSVYTGVYSPMVKSMHFYTGVYSPMAKGMHFYNRVLWAWDVDLCPFFQPCHISLIKILISSLSTSLPILANL